MATDSFSFVYWLDGAGQVQAGEDLGGAANPITDVTADSGLDPTLVTDEGFTFSPAIFGASSGTFDYASDDGFVATIDGERYFFTDTSRTAGYAPPDEGTSFVLCFLAGTLIATPAGAVAIETLKAGDLVLTAQGVARPVRWLARQTVATFFADPLRVLPVRIRAGALGEGLPLRDLLVSPDHALELDGLLVQAGALVNGASILREADMPSSLVYYHVELDDHSLVLAEGVAAESFVDNVSRRRFDNWQEAPEAPVAELDLPRVKSARQLPPALRARLASRLAALGPAAGKVA